jgi:SAM-dependent methyltransferase
MNERTRLALNAINRDFYQRHAHAFSRTRAAPWPGWRRVLDHIPALPRPNAPLSALDVGCGNGRFGRYLVESLGFAPRYVGIDSSPQLLADARQALSELQALLLLEHDVVAAPEQQLLPVEAGVDHDVAVLFGMLHHVPAAERRRALVAACAERLRPGGLLAVSFWQYAGRDRFDKKIVPWQWATERYAVDHAELEPGDQLLRWGSGLEAARFCHFISPDEARALLSLQTLEPIETFEADGKTSDLNHYVLLRRRS